jgi:ribonuclease P protein component
MTQSDQSFPKQLRIKRQTDFDRVFENGAVASDAQLVVHGVKNELGVSRLGLSISKKVGNSPVRNCWKRLIREAFRTNKSAMPSSFDFVVRPRRGALPEFSLVAASLPKLAKQIERRLNRS